MPPRKTDTMNRMEEQVERIWQDYQVSWIGDTYALYMALLRDKCKGGYDLSPLCEELIREMGFNSFRDFDRATPNQYEQLFNTLRRYAKNWAFAS